MKLFRHLRDRLFPSRHAPSRRAPADPWSQLVASDEFLVAEIDRCALIRDANPVFCGLRGEDPGELAGTSLLYLLAAADREGFSLLFRGVFLGAPGGALVARLLVEGQDPPTIRWSVLPRYDAAGKVEAVVCIGIDVSAVARKAAPEPDTRELGDLRQARILLEREVEALRREGEGPDGGPGDLEELRLANRQLEAEVEGLRAELARHLDEPPGIDPAAHEKLRESEQGLAAEVEELRAELRQREEDPEILAGKLDEVREAQLGLERENESLRTQLAGRAAAVPDDLAGELEELRAYQALLEEDNEQLRARAAPPPPGKHTTPSLPGLHPVAEHAT